MSSAIDEVIKLQNQRRQESANAYRDLVKQLATGRKKTPAADVIDQTLRDAGKTVTDLEDDVQKCKDRNVQRGAVAKTAGMEKTREALQAKIAKAKAVLNKAQETYDATVAPLHQEIHSINQAFVEAETARAELLRTAPDYFDDQRDEIEQRLRVAEREKDVASKHLREMEGRVPGMVEGVNRGTNSEAEAAELAEWVEKAKQRVQDSSQTVKELVAEQEQLIAEMAAA